MAHAQGRHPSFVRYPHRVTESEAVMRVEAARTQRTRSSDETERARRTRRAEANVVDTLERATATKPHAPKAKPRGILQTIADGIGRVVDGIGRAVERFAHGVAGGFVRG